MMGRQTDRRLGRPKFRVMSRGSTSSKEQEEDFFGGREERGDQG